MKISYFSRQQADQTRPDQWSRRKEGSYDDMTADSLLFCLISSEVNQPTVP